MPRDSIPKKRQNKHDTYIMLKAVVIALRFLYQETFQEIERKIGVKSSTAQLIWHQAKELAGNEDLHDLGSLFRKI